MKKFLTYMHIIEEYSLILSLMFSVILIGAQVLMRYIFNNALSWTEELARYIFIWQTWIGAGYATRMGKHLRITIIPDKIKTPLNQLLFNLIINIIWLSFALLLAFEAALLLKKLYISGQISPAMEILIAYPYAGVLIGCVTMCINLLNNILNTFKNMRC